MTGKEKYAADYYGPDFLWRAKRAGIPHGRLLGIDAEEAASAPASFPSLLMRTCRDRTGRA